jgi:hypothetical protein
MTNELPTPTTGAAGEIETVANDIEALSSNPSVVALEAPLLARLPKNVRGGIYEAGKAAGLVGAAGFAVAGVLEGKTQLYAIAGAALLLSLSSWVSKANLS